MTELAQSEITESRAPRPWLLLLCMLVVVLASYIPVLGGPFIWDDHHLVEQSNLVKQLHPLRDYFGQGFWQHDDAPESHTYYRPFVILSFALDHALYADNSGGFHLTNLLLHLLGAWLLYQLLLRGRVSANAATLGSAFWALAPRLTEAVAWISGRTDVLATVFVLGALLLSTVETTSRRVGSALLLLAGLFSKEVAIAGVAAIVVQEWRRGRTLRDRLTRLLPSVLATATYAALRMHAIGGQMTAATQLRPVLRLEAVLASIARYATMLLGPWFPDIQIGQLTRPELGFVALGFVLLAMLAGLAIKLRKQPLSAETAGLLALITVSLGLVLHVIPFSVNVVAADRFLYLPLAGLTLLFTPLVTRLPRPRWVAIGSTLVVASFAAVTFVRASIWSDEVALWAVAYRQARVDPSTAAVEFGSVYSRAGLYPQALSLFASAVGPTFDNTEVALNNIGTTSLRIGRYQDAAHLFSELSEKVPDTPKYVMNWAVTETYIGDFSAARRLANQAIARFPGYELPRSFKARLPELRQNRALLDAAPADLPVIERARLLGRLGLAAEAVQAWRAALQLRTPTRDEMEEALWFAIQVGDADTVAAFHARYAQTFAGQLDPKLELVCQARAELVSKLRAAWPTLGLTLPEHP